METHTQITSRRPSGANAARRHRRAVHAERARQRDRSRRWPHLPGLHGNVRRHTACAVSARPVAQGCENDNRCKTDKKIKK